MGVHVDKRFKGLKQVLIMYLQEHNDKGIITGLNCSY